MHMRLMRVIRFMMGGCLGVTLFFTTCYVLTDVLGVWYVTSSMLGSILNWTSNFIFQKYWVFKDKDNTLLERQAGYYLSLAVALSLLNVGGVVLLMEIFKMAHIPAQTLVAIFITGVSYITSRAIFHRGVEAEEQAYLTQT